MEPSNARVSDFLWYSRLFVWAGCGALLVEAFSGKSYGYLTIVAVIFLIAGFVGFMGALAFRGRSPMWLTSLAEVPTASVDRASAQTDQTVFRPAPTVESAELPADSAESVPLSHPTPEPARTASPAVPRTVETRELEVSSAALGQRCPHCGKTLEVGQIGAICWSCETPQHATCWAENRFHCATPGCEGTGSLEAPVGGPSKP